LVESADRSYETWGVVLKPYYMRLKIPVIFVSSLGLLIFSFQNCSKTNFSAVESSYVTGTEVRKISLDPSSDQKATESGLLKVMLVVDNSATMKNSQENLKRNISYLLSTLKNRNAEVTIITSDYADRHFSQANDSIDPVTKTAYAAGYKRVFQPSVASRRPVYKFSKTDDAALFAKNIDSVSRSIETIGTNGSDSEAQLFSFGASLNYETFFKKGDAALIYFITDEDDQHTFNPNVSYIHRVYNLNQVSKPYARVSCKNCFSYQYTWFREDGKTEAGTSAPNFSSMTSCTASYNSVQSNSAYRIKAPCVAVQSGINLASSYTTCESYLKSNPYPSEEVTCVDSQENHSSVVNDTYYSLYNSEYSRVRTQVNSRGLPPVSGDSVRMNLYQYDLFSGLKKHMDELFDKKYFIGVSTNLRGQNCSLSTGQSYDSVFGLLSSIIPKDQMLISSICDSVNFQANLEAVSKSFEKIIKSDYVLDIDVATESVIAIDLILADKTVVSLMSDQYVVYGQSLSFKNIDLNKYDIKQIEILLNKNIMDVKKEAK
jgi:KaiC/GvpD/RAD55 family RecA-like ATPase